MHGVGEADGAEVVDNDTDGGVGAEVVDVPFGVVWVGIVACFGQEKDWVVVVGAEAGVVHGEEKMSGCVLLEVDVNLFGGGGVWGGCDGIPGDGFR